MRLIYAGRLFSTPTNSVAARCSRTPHQAVTVSQWNVISLFHRDQLQDRPLLNQIKCTEVTWLKARILLGRQQQIRSINSRWNTNSMITRRFALKVAFVGGLSAIPLTHLRAADGKLAWQYFQADAAGFGRTPVLLTGEQDAILLDGGFTLPFGRAIAKAIKATGKRLTTIYVSRNDPDYYFGLGPIVEDFPKAEVLAKPVTVEAINANVEKKLEVWRSQLGDSGPQVLADVIIPEASGTTSLLLEGNRIEIIEVPDMFDRRYIWVPSLMAVFGGALINSGIHVWLADTPTPEARAAWVRALDAIAVRDPLIVIPGHQSEGAEQGPPAITFTREYLAAFEEEMRRTKDSAELIAAMSNRYPRLARRGSLELSAKVAKGEMKWG
jgi:glyoxylase-like metal-dependent hydrolase (beta-lactamase superfamily II)